MVRQRTIPSYTERQMTYLCNETKETVAQPNLKSPVESCSYALQ